MGVGEVAKAVFFMFFVYYIYCTTLLIYGMVKRKKRKILLHDQTVYIYIYYVDMNMMYVNCQLGNNNAVTNNS
jgi:hypothetical protein